MTFRLQMMSSIVAMVVVRLTSIERLVRAAVLGENVGDGDQRLGALAAFELVESSRDSASAWYLLGLAHGRRLIRARDDMRPRTAEELAAHVRGVLEALVTRDAVETAVGIVRDNPDAAEAALGPPRAAWQHRLVIEVHESDPELGLRLAAVVGWVIGA